MTPPPATTTSYRAGTPGDRECDHAAMLRFGPTPGPAPAAAGTGVRSARGLPGPCILSALHQGQRRPGRQDSTLFAGAESRRSPDGGDTSPEGRPWPARTLAAQGPPRPSTTRRSSTTRAGSVSSPTSRVARATRLVAPGPGRPGASRPPGRVGGRGGHRRRGGDPHPAAPSVPRRRGGRPRHRACPSRAATRPVPCSSRPTPTTPGRPGPSSRPSPTRRGSRVLGWREVPGPRHDPRGDGQAGPAADRAGLRRAERPGPDRRARSSSTGSPSSSASAPSTRSTASTSRRCRPGRSSTRACSPATSWTSSTPTSPTSGSSRASPSSTRAFRPTRSRAGRSPTRTGTWPTTARSTPCAGNRNWMRAREALLETDLIEGDLSRVFPICTPGASDSASFDEVLELLAPGRPVAARTRCS